MPPRKEREAATPTPPAPEPEVQTPPPAELEPQPEPEPVAEEAPPAEAVDAAALAEEDEEDDRLKEVFARLEGLVVDAPLNVATLGADLRDLMLELFRHRPKAFGEMKADEQRDTARLVTNAVNAALAEAVTIIAAEDRPSIDARLEKFAVKGGKYQVTLIAVGGPDLAADLARLDGHEVLIISADAAPFTRARAAPISPDQAPLEFHEPEPRPEPDAEELYTRAVDLVRESRSASTSFVQRQLRLGYNAAAALLERMEREGIVSAADEKGARTVIAPPPEPRPEREWQPDKASGGMELINTATGVVLETRPMTDEERAEHGLEPLAAEEMIDGTGEEELDAPERREPPEGSRGEDEPRSEPGEADGE